MDSVLRSSYRLYILGTMYTYFSTKRPRTNINFTDIINAHGRFKSRQEVARLLFLDKKCRKMFFQRACKYEHLNLPMVIVHYV